MKKVEISFPAQILIVPMIAFLAMIFTVGAIGSFVDMIWFRQHLPNAFPIFVVWCLIGYIKLAVNRLRKTV